MPARLIAVMLLLCVLPSAATGAGIDRGFGGPYLWAFRS